MDKTQKSDYRLPQYLLPAEPGSEHRFPHSWTPSLYPDLSFHITGLRVTSQTVKDLSNLDA